MTVSDYTHITLVVDRSGSMGSMQSAAQEGIDAFVATQRVVPGRASFTLIEFNSDIHTVGFWGNIKNFSGYSLVPAGGTALLDAVGQAIVLTGQKLDSMHEQARPGKVVVMVVTDGGENASKEFTADGVRAMVKHQEEKYGWQFIYVGSDVAAWDAGLSLGFANNTRSYATRGSTMSTYAGASASIGNYRTGTTQTTIMPEEVDAEGTASNTA